MNDHNLDDLIIDNIEPKNSKAKSILTIVALLIVVLIVAIILTSVLLDSPKKDAVLQEDNETEMISPELTLQNAGKVKTPEAETRLNDIIEEELNKPVSKRNTTVEPTLKPEVKRAEESIPAPEPQEKEVPEVIKPEVAETEAPKVEKQEEVPAPEEKVIEPEAETKPVSKPAPVAEKAKAPVKKAHGIAYYIQVGAYKHTPSKQIIRSIKSQGFSYRIMTANGTKKLLIGPYASKSSVDSALLRVRDRINKQAFIVKK